MNEQANIELVENLYAAFGRGDIQFILDHLSSDVEWSMEGPEILPFVGNRHGHDEVMGFFQALATTQSGQRLTMTDTFAQGNKVATFGHYAATVNATGKSFNSRAAHLFEIRDGKVVKFVDMVDTAMMASAYQSSAAAAH